MMEEFINNFLKYGFLKDIKLGMSMGEVLKILQIPKEKTFRESRKRVGLETENLSLSFFKGKLDVVKINFEGGKTKFPPAIFTNYITIATNPKNLIQCLTGKQIKANTDERFSNETTTCFKVDSGLSNKCYSEMLIYFAKEELLKVIAT